MAYTPHSWTLDDAITDTLLNHIEGGIDDAHTDTASLDGRLDTAESDITVLQGSMSAAESNVSTLMAVKDDPACSVYRETDMTLPFATWTGVPFEALSAWGGGGENMWTSGVPSVITIPTSGVYMLHGYIAVQPNGAGGTTVAGRIAVAGTYVVVNPHYNFNFNPEFNAFSTVWYCSAGQQVSLEAFAQQTGTSDAHTLTFARLAAVMVSR